MQHLRGRAWHRRDNPEWLEDSAFQLYGVSGFRVLELGLQCSCKGTARAVSFQKRQCLHNLFRTDNGVAEGF